MYNRRVSIASFTVAMISTIGLYGYTVTVVHAAGPCTGGSHIVSQAEIDSSGGKIPAGTTICDSDTGGVSLDAGQAKAYILSISTKSSTADKAHVDMLNNSFAICSAQFFKAFQQKYPQYAPLKVTSTWRSQADQGRVSSSPTSNHTRGLAIDVHPNGQTQAGYDMLMNFAIANKQFGVCFARPQYEGSPDRPHMTAADIGSNKENCAKYGITKMCDAGGKFDPSKSNPAAPSSASAYGSSLPGDSALRGLLGQQQQPPYNPMMANQTLPQSQQPFSSIPTSGSGPSSGSSQGGTLGSPGGSSGGSTYTSGGGGNLGSGGGISTIGSGGPSPILGQPIIVGTTSTTSTASSSGPSIWDQLSAIANQGTDTSTSVPTSSTTPVVLNEDLTQYAPRPTEPSSSSSNATTFPGNIAMLRPTDLGPQTFVSNDLSGSVSAPTAPRTGSSFLVNILQRFKLILLGILEQLKPLLTPMGINASGVRGYSEGGE